MIFTRHFGALAARPTFDRVIVEQDDLDRELHDLLNDVDVETAGERRG